MLDRLSRTIASLTTEGNFTYSVVVCDNDAGRSGERAVELVRQESSLKIAYFIQPEKNIALARNTTVINATGEYIAFIDDDEFPDAGWL